MGERFFPGSPFPPSNIMRYGIFGGGFDPIHLGHLLLAECCREYAALDRVIFVPTGVSPHRQGKGGYHAPARNRLEMVELAIDRCEGLLVSNFEANRRETSFTIDTLRFLSNTLTEPDTAVGRPGSELFLILGADMYSDLPNWREAEEIQRLATPLVAHRTGFDFPEPGRPTLTVPMPRIDISSSVIRARLAQKKSIRFQVPRAVELYIHENRLYET